MSISSGYDKFKDYHQTEDGSYKLTSRWTSSNTVELDDGSTVEEKFTETDSKLSENTENIENLKNHTHETDTTLSVEGKAADAKAVGNAIFNIDVPKDWNQNDASAKDYIKNRPMYESETVIFDERLVFELYSVTGSLYSIYNATGKEISAPRFTVGKRYTVIIDDASYEVECKYNYGLGSNPSYNQDCFNEVLEDNHMDFTEYPFVIFSGAEVDIAPTYSEGAHYIKIIEYNANKLPTKYLPDILDTMEEIEANTQENQLAGALAVKELEERVVAGFEEIEDKIRIHNFTAGETILDFAVANNNNRVMGFITSAAVPSDSPTSEECFVIIERDTDGGRMMVRLRPYNGWHQWEYQRSIWDSAWREDKWILKEYLQLTGGMMTGEITGDGGGRYPTNGNVFVSVEGFNDYLTSILYSINSVFNGQRKITRIVSDESHSIAPSGTAFDSAQFQAYANYAQDPSKRAGYGFHNHGLNGVFLFLDHDGRLKTAHANSGDITTLIRSDMITVSGNEIILEWL